MIILLLCFRLGHHCPSSYNPADFFIKTLSHTEIESTAISYDDHESSANLIDINDQALDFFLLKPCEVYVIIIIFRFFFHNQIKIMNF